MGWPKRIALAFAIGSLGGLHLFRVDAALADAVGAELIILTTHVQNERDAPVERYKRKLDRKGRFVLTPGIEVYYDKELSEPLWKARYIRTSAGLLQDSVAHQFGYFAVMGRWILHEGDPLQISLHAGPGFIFRETWRDVPGYRADNVLQESERFLPGYEYKFLILGEVDLLYRITPNLQGVWSIFPGFPFVVIQNLGLRWSF